MYVFGQMGILTPFTIAFLGVIEPDLNCVFRPAKRKKNRSWIKRKYRVISWSSKEKYLISIDHLTKNLHFLPPGSRDTKKSSAQLSFVIDRHLMAFYWTKFKDKLIFKERFPVPSKGQFPWLLDSHAPRFPGSLAPRLPGFQAPGLPGSQAPRLSGFQALRFPGSQTSQAIMPLGFHSSKFSGQALRFFCGLKRSLH